MIGFIGIDGEPEGSATTSETRQAWGMPYRLLSNLLLKLLQVRIAQQDSASRSCRFEMILPSRLLSYLIRTSQNSRNMSLLPTRCISIAEQFGIREETILGGNPFLQNDAGQLWAGTDITILPVDGVLHVVVEGDTVESLAEQSGVPAEDIINYEPNKLEFPYRLSPGTQIVVPGAVAEVWVWDPPSLVASEENSSPEALQGVQIVVPGTGTFIRPWTGGRITQNPMVRTHGYRHGPGHRIADLRL